MMRLKCPVTPALFPSEGEWENCRQSHREPSVTGQPVSESSVARTFKLQTLLFPTPEPTHPQPLQGGEQTGGRATTVPLLGGDRGGSRGTIHERFSSEESPPIGWGEGQGEGFIQLNSAGYEGA